MSSILALELDPRDSTNASLSSGAVAGIVFSVIVLCSVVIALFIWLFMRFRRRQRRTVRPFQGKVDLADAYVPGHRSQPSDTSDAPLLNQSRQSHIIVYDASEVDPEQNLSPRESFQTTVSSWLHRPPTTYSILSEYFRPHRRDTETIPQMSSPTYTYQGVGNHERAPFSFPRTYSEDTQPPRIVIPNDVQRVSASSYAATRPVATLETIPSATTPGTSLNNANSESGYSLARFRTMIDQFPAPPVNPPSNHNSFMAEVSTTDYESELSRGNTKKIGNILKTRAKQVGSRLSRSFAQISHIERPGSIRSLPSPPEEDSRPVYKHVTGASMDSSLRNYPSRDMIRTGRGNKAIPPPPTLPPPTQPPKIPLPAPPVQVPRVPIPASIPLSSVPNRPWFSPPTSPNSSGSNHSIPFDVDRSGGVVFDTFMTRPLKITKERDASTHRKSSSS